MQRFANTKPGRRPEIERPAQLLYICDAEASYTRLPRAMHRHEDCIELVFIREGVGSHIVGGRRYQTRKGDILIYNSGVLHDESTSGNADLSVYCCAFKGLKLKGLPENVLPLSRGGAVLNSTELYPEFASLLQMLYGQVNARHQYAAVFCNQLLQALITLLLSLIRDSAPQTLTTRHDLGAQVKNYIDERYQDDIDLKSMSAELRISPYYLAHKFKSTVGCSPRQYLIRRRVGEAQSLLINTDMTVTEIATRVGYDNSNYFITAFKKVVGITPSGYRKQCIE